MVLYARGWLGEAGAEDVVQEAFVKLLMQVRRPGDVRAWLYRCVRNAALGQWRKRRVRLKHQEEVAARTAEREQGWFESRAEDVVDASAAEAALRELEEKQREVVVLRIWGQLTWREIGRVTGAPVSTAVKRYQQALGEIRRRMQRCETTDSAN